MGPDEKLDPREAERRKLLEEIRQRAEEAELRRIEAEEGQSAASVESEEQTPEPTAQPVALESQPPPRPKPQMNAAEEHRLIELRGRFAVAIDHSDLDQAADVILDLVGLIPDTVELASYQNKIRALRQKLREERAAPVAPPPVAEAGSQRERHSIEKKVNALMEESTSFYEQEKYDKAESAVGRLLELDPGNEDAVDLRARIAKAQELAAEVRAEEEKRRAEGPGAQQVSTEPVPGFENQKKKDFWGSTEIPNGDTGYGLSVEEDADTQHPPKQPLFRRIVERASDITIPVKPILITAVMILAVVVGYFVAGDIQIAASDLSSSVLVLPGWHDPSDTLASYLAYAVLEQITHDLSATPDLRVIGPRSASSVQYIKGGPAAAARNLRARYYLHWKITTNPAMATFDLTLRDTAGVEPVWTLRKQSSLRELPATAAEIASSILTSLDLQEAGQETSGIVAGMSSDENALLDYFKGRYMLGSPDQFTVRSAGMFFDDAIRADPGFRAAGIAKAWTLLRESEGSIESPRSLLTDASRILASAGSEGATTAFHLAAIGLAEQMHGRFEQARTFFDTGVRFFPADPELRRRSAILSMIRGEYDEALAHAERAVELDPLNAESFLVLGAIHRVDDARKALQDYQQAARLSHERNSLVVSRMPELMVEVQQHDSAETILSNEIGRTRGDYQLHYRLGRVYQAAGKPISRWGETLERAQTLLARQLAASPDDGVARSYLALVLTRLGKQKDAEVELNRALRDRREHPAVLYNAARVYSMQRNEAAALEHLDKAIGLRYDLEMIADMDFYNLRAQSAFISVVTR